METKHGQQANDLISALLGNHRVRSFDFFRFMRVVEASCSDQVPPSPRIGTSWSLKDDPIRFCQPPFQGTAASTIERFIRKDENSQPRLYVNFFGLFGPHGPLPWHLTEYAQIRRKIEYEARLDETRPPAEADSPKESTAAPVEIEAPEEQWDSVLNAFCDVFHHRLISFFYRAWASHQRVTEFDRNEAEIAKDNRVFRKYLGSFSGYGLSCLQGQLDRLPGTARLYHSGWLSSAARPPEGLKSILEDFLSIKTDVLSFVSHWIEARECRNASPLGFWPLGKSRSTSTLGHNSIIGSRHRERQLKFRLRLGPMNLDDYVRFLPPVSDPDVGNETNPAAIPNRGDAIKRVRAWVRTYVGFEYFWDVQLVLEAESVPKMVLGRSSELGRTTWLKNQRLAEEHPCVREVAGLLFDPESITESTASTGR